MYFQQTCFIAYIFLQNIQISRPVSRFSSNNGRHASFATAIYQRFLLKQTLPQQISNHYTSYDKK